jgi:GNAT superfamily N-acetyltransferase
MARPTSSTLRAPHLVVAVTCVSARCHGLLFRLPIAILPRDECPKLRRHNEDVHLTVLDGLPADHEAAVRVWHAANVARLPPPSLDRVARIREKLAEPEACLVIGHVDANMGVVAMALVEPGREQHSGGAVIRGYGHVSMVFVHPDMWGRGVGRQLLQGLHKRASERGWSRRCGPGRRTRALNACTKARDIEGRAMKRPLAAVIPSSSSMVKHPDQRRSVEDPKLRHQEKVPPGCQPSNNGQPSLPSSAADSLASIVVRRSNTSRTSAATSLTKGYVPLSAIRRK